MSDLVESLADRLAATATAECRSLYVIVDGAGDRAGALADELACALSAVGQHNVRLSDRNPLADEDAWMADHRPGMVVVADGPRWRAQPPGGTWDFIIDS